VSLHHEGCPESGSRPTSEFSESPGHQAAPEGEDNRGKPRAQRGNLPLVLDATRPRRHQRREPVPGGPVRPVITLGLRPGKLRKLTWDLVDLNRGVVHVRQSASKTGDTKTPQSKRSLVFRSAPSPPYRPTRRCRTASALTQLGTFRRTELRKTVELRGFEPLTFCMPCSSEQSNGEPPASANDLAGLR
jgi:hypothetical protein